MHVTNRTSTTPTSHSTTAYCSFRYNIRVYIDSYTNTLLLKTVYDEVCMIILSHSEQSSNYTYVISLISSPLEATSVATKIFT